MDRMLSRLCDCLKPDGRPDDGDTGRYSTRLTTEGAGNHVATDKSTDSDKYRGYPYEESVNTLLSLPTPVSDNNIAFGCGDGSLMCYDCDDGSLRQKWEGHSKSITKICHRTPNTGMETPSYIFSASRDQSVKMWSTDGTDRQHIQEFTGLHDLVITSVACNPADANMMCTGSRDNNIALWDVNTGSVIYSNKIARNLVTDVCWKGELLAQTSEDKSLRLWDSRVLKPTHTFVKKQQILTSCDVSGNYVVTSCGGFNGSGCELTLWDSRGGEMPVLELKGHTEKVHRCCYVTTGNSSKQLVISVSADRTIKLWNLNTFSEQTSFSLSHQAITISQLPSADARTLRFGIGCFENSGVVIVTVNLDCNQWNVYD